MATNLQFFFGIVGVILVWVTVGRSGQRELLEISGDIRKFTLASLFVPMHAVLSIPLFKFSTGSDTYIPART